MNYTHRIKEAIGTDHFSLLLHQPDEQMIITSCYGKPEALIAGLTQAGFLTPQAEECFRKNAENFANQVISTDIPAAQNNKQPGRF